MLNMFVIAFIFFNTLILFFIYKIRKKERIENVKLEDIKDIIIEKSLKHKLNFVLYKDFFDITSYLYYNLKPISINVYLYYDDYNDLNTKIIKFIYKLGDNDVIDCQNCSLLDNSPISLFNFINKIYTNHNISKVKVKTLKDYDIDAYDRFTECGIKTLYFKNLYRDGSNIPYGFVLLTYKEEKLDDEKMEIFITEVNKLTVNLAKILHIYNL